MTADKEKMKLELFKTILANSSAKRPSVFGK